MPMPCPADAARRDDVPGAARHDDIPGVAHRDDAPGVARRDDVPGAAASDDGFTLLEVLVAFAIAALALGVLFEGAVGGIRSARVADRTAEALSRAQSHLAAVGQGLPLAPGTRNGDDGSGYRWSVRIRPERSAVAAQSRIVLYAVQVTESWGENDGDAAPRSVVLRTERLGAARGDAS